MKTVFTLNLPYVTHVTCQRPTARSRWNMKCSKYSYYEPPFHSYWLRTCYLMFSIISFDSDTFGLISLFATVVSKATLSPK